VHPFAGDLGNNARLREEGAVQAEIRTDGVILNKVKELGEVVNEYKDLVGLAETRLFFILTPSEPANSELHHILNRAEV
jgi:hypothetical protein